MENELNYTLIGVRLRAIRLKKGYTQEYIAECAGISAQHCSGIECGKAKVSLPALIRLCNALEVTPDAVLMDSIDKNAPQLSKEIAAVFADCSNDEIFLMLSMVDSFKKSMRVKDLRLTRE